MQRMMTPSSSWLFAQASVVIFPPTVPDPGWGIADSILQACKYARDKVGASLAMQTGKRFFLVGNVYPSQS